MDAVFQGVDIGKMKKVYPFIYPYIERLRYLGFSEDELREEIRRLHYYDPCIKCHSKSDTAYCMKEETSAYHRYKAFSDAIISGDFRMEIYLRNSLSKSII